MLRGVTALVTGGSRGIGRACAEKLARDGARVVITSRDLENARDVASALTSDNSELPQHTGVQCDVRDANQVRALFKEIQRGATAAQKPLAVVVNAAGVNHDSLLVRISDDKIEVSFADFELSACIVVVPTH